jgi:prolipoprotein diacylglyceryltransferase
MCVFSLCGGILEAKIWLVLGYYLHSSVVFDSVDIVAPVVPVV